jgi:hypothetical protein
MGGELITAQDALVARLQDDVADLHRQLAEKDRALVAEHRSTTAAMKNLRRVLSPLYTALRQVFGDLDPLLAGSDDDPPSAATGRTASVWADWKTKLPHSCGKVIDALLLHGPMTQSQIIVAAKISPNTLGGGSGVIARMNKAALWTKRDGKYALREF